MYEGWWGAGVGGGMLGTGVGGSVVLEVAPSPVLVPAPALAMG